jgi:hypothetical protein
MKLLYSKTLFDPFEEELYLPATAIELCNGKHCSSETRTVSFSLC